ncbi:HisA/HisF-related TIM barrel protein [Desulfosporosinus lacus]|uniref:Phosphoribosylformimino-5-aminoimidazole carboxamide ribotide isomerase n=1 Tax=Desulfosporosinus lacus DSM 15449 TaxID=1121420 RepID=A0A1M5ZZR7_9FIRM|nr:HisA/HisF-related TIM barrel protein [Desulfosporosinus lacus]SHI29777.1 phosphoribosylformimino-5-aminoimidazole carboxamide ribotide isomerase [Desulfosporosinus lacus DSM 15449]
MNKKLFRVIPALDLKNGVVVHGIRGEREKYQPIESILSMSPELSPLVDGFVQQLGLREFYVADLDAIMSSMKKDHLNFVAQKNAERVNNHKPLSFMIDAGVYDVDGVGKVLAAGADQVIIGTETLPSLAMLQEIINHYGRERLVVSLDIKDGKIMSAAVELTRLTPPQAMRELMKLGIQQFILLELSRVGTGAGLNKTLIKECLAVLGVQPKKTKMTGSLILGGGVSGYEDLRWLMLEGVSGAIVASALHDGRLTKEKLCQLKELQKYK